MPKMFITCCTTKQITASFANSIWFSYSCNGIIWALSHMCNKPQYSMWTVIISIIILTMHGLRHLITPMNIISGNLWGLKYQKETDQSKNVHIKSRHQDRSAKTEFEFKKGNAHNDAFHIDQCSLNISLANFRPWIQHLNTLLYDVVIFI